MLYHDKRYGDFEYTDEDRERDATIQLWRSGADMQITNKQAESLFDKLAMALKKEKLPTRKGEMRQAEPGEFMLMNVTPSGVAQFKHSDTRNYVFLKADGSLEVPRTKEPFFQGEFDIFE